MVNITISKFEIASLFGLYYVDSTEDGEHIFEFHGKKLSSWAYRVSEAEDEISDEVLSMIGNTAVMLDKVTTSTEKK